MGADRRQAFTAQAPSLTPDLRLAQDLRSGRTSPVYLLFGEEEFLLSRATSVLVEHLVASETRDFNLIYLDGEKLSIEGFVDAVRSFPLFGSSRLTVVRKAELLPPSLVDQLAAELDSPAPGAVVAFVAVASAKEDKLKKLAAKVRKVGMLLEFPPLKEGEASLWLVRHTQEQFGAELPLAVGRELVASLGTDLRLLSSEVNKLCTFAGNRKRITSEDVAQVAGRIPLANIFQLIDTVARGQAGTAMTHLADLYALGQPESYVLHMLAWHFRNLLTAKELVDSGVHSAEAVAARTGLAPYPARKALSQAHLFAEKELVEALTLVLATGVGMRQRRLDSRVAMQTLILKLCGRKEKGALI